MAASKHVSLPSPFASGDPTEWFTRFEICCVANDWDDTVKAKKMPTLQEGEALAVYLDLSEDEKKDYKVARKKLIDRLAPMKFTSLDEFHARKLHPGESLSVFLHMLKRILTQAMPESDAATRQQLLRHQFLSGLPSTVSKQLRAAGTVDDLDAIVQRAKLLMTLEQTSEKAASVDKVDLDSTIGQLQQQIAALTDQVAALSSKRNPAISSESGARRCFRCHQLGHVQRNCPQAPRCFTCGRPGHFAKNCQSGNGRGMSRMGPRHPQN